jgi:hypothetical protein
MTLHPGPWGQGCAEPCRDVLHWLQVGHAGNDCKLNHAYLSRLIVDKWVRGHQRHDLATPNRQRTTPQLAGTRM